MCCECGITKILKWSIIFIIFALLITLIIIVINYQNSQTQPNILVAVAEAR